MRLELTPKHLQEIQEAAQSIRDTGSFRKHFTVNELQKMLYQAQHALRGWKGSPVNRRGYFYKPDCAAELLRDCRAYRRVLRMVGADLRDCNASYRTY